MKRVTIAVLTFGATYVILAYIVLPAIWTHYEHQPGLANRTMLTVTPQGIPGDPINAGLIGDSEDIVRAMHEAGWFAANAVTLRSSIGIIGSIVLRRQYQAAPVSVLLYDG